ncbi:hypothetical protein J2TS4_58110 [Paenibacillus sp. J2TS4]|nr:hypothetical protein J2TS4_58110 [Paenibacillus sp. J2TS4]
MNKFSHIDLRVNDWASIDLASSFGFNRKLRRLVLFIEARRCGQG